MPLLADAALALACQAAAFAPAVLAGVTRTAGPAAAPWYERLKPRWTPPPAVFPVVWTALYACIGAALFLAVRFRAAVGPWPAALIAVNLALNAAWSPLFFGRAAFGAALATVAGMIVTAAGAAAAFALRGRGAVRAWGVALLAPYIAWLCFAAALNAAVLGASRRAPRG